MVGKLNLDWSEIEHRNNDVIPTMLNNYRYEEIIFEPLKISEIMGERISEPGADDHVVFSAYCRVDVSSLSHI